MFPRRAETAVRAALLVLIASLLPWANIRAGEAGDAPRSAPAAAATCGVCHGQDLRGLGPVPPIAGRSPSYVVRQLVDFQNGTRNGRWSALMKPVVANLTVSDMVSIAAYTASRTP